MKKVIVCCLICALHLGAAWAGDAGVTGNEIRLGASVVLTGPFGPQNQEYGAGSRLYFDSVNLKGGIFGRKIVYTTLDDGFDVKRSVENTKKLINDDKVFLIYNNTGTAHTAAILPLLEESKTVLFGPFTGASVFREKVNRYMFHVRAGYANEARRIVSQLKRTGITRVVVFYQDDGFGKALLAEIQKAAIQENLPLLAEVKVDTNQPDYQAAALSSEKFSPQAVIMGSAGAIIPRFIKAVSQTASRPSFYGFSLANLEVINKELGPAAQGVVIAQVMPSLKSSSMPIVMEYRRLLSEKQPGAPLSTSQFEGFVHATLLVEGLRRAGRKLTTESFIKGLEAAGEIRYGQFSVKYSPESHNGSSYVELAIIDSNGQLRY